MKQSNQTSLKKATQDYFDDITLSDTQLADLQSLINNSNDYDDADFDTQKDANIDMGNDDNVSIENRGIEKSGIEADLSPVNTQKNNTGNWRWLAIAASVLLVFSFAFNQLKSGSGSVQDGSYLIAKEVAKNHLKLNPLEVKSSDFDTVSRYFDTGKVDFKPMPSSFLKVSTGGNLNLLGARYCSIKSVTASQIRYKNKANKVVTFYEVGYDADTFGSIPDIDKDKKPIVHYINGMKVNIWVEKGLLMASIVNMH